MTKKRIMQRWRKAGHKLGAAAKQAEASFAKREQKAVGLLLRRLLGKRHKALYVGDTLVCELNARGGVLI